MCLLVCASCWISLAGDDVAGVGHPWWSATYGSKNPLVVVAVHRSDWGSSARTAAAPSIAPPLPILCADVDRLGSSRTMAVSWFVVRCHYWWLWVAVLLATVVAVKKVGEEGRCYWSWLLCDGGGSQAPARHSLLLVVCSRSTTAVPRTAAKP